MSGVSRLSGTTLRALVLGLAVLALVAWGAYEVWQRHHRVQNLVAQLEPRYARLLGMKAGASEIAATIEANRALLERHVFPAGQDASQVGNATQQRLRELFAAAGMEVVSSQILPVKTVEPFDRIALSLRVEGQVTALQTFFVGLQASTPSIWLEGFGIQPIGTFRAEVPQRLSVNLNFFVLRARE